MRCVGMKAEEIAGGHVRVELVYAPAPDLISSPNCNYTPPDNNRPPRYQLRNYMGPSDQNDLPDDINDLAASVRRHHTISSVRRGHRAQPRIPISEVENEDEVVGNDWVGGVGVVGEGKGLHRQSSLPSKYNNRGASTHQAKAIAHCDASARGHFNP